MDHASGRSELDGVFQHVPEHLLKPCGIRADRNRFRRRHAFQFEGFLKNLGLADIADLAHQLVKIHVLQPQGKLAAGDAATSS